MHLFVAGDRVLQPAAAEVQKRRAKAGTDLQEPEIRFAGQPVSLPCVPEAILVTPLCRFDLGDDDQCVTCQVGLTSRLGQLESLAPMRQRLHPPAGFFAHASGPLERVRKPTYRAFGTRQLYRAFGVLP